MNGKSLFDQQMPLPARQDPSRLLVLLALAKARGVSVFPFGLSDEAIEREILRIERLPDRAGTHVPVITGIYTVKSSES